MKEVFRFFSAHIFKRKTGDYCVAIYEDSSHIVYGFGVFSSEPDAYSAAEPDAYSAAELVKLAVENVTGTSAEKPTLRLENLVAEMAANVDD